jgi:hypothetical protein
MEKFILEGRIKEYVNGKGFDFGEKKEVFDFLNTKIQALIDAGLIRASGNGRSTLLERDL